MFAFISLVFAALLYPCGADIVDVGRDGHFETRHSIVPVQPHKAQTNLVPLGTQAEPAPPIDQTQPSPILIEVESVDQANSESDVRASRVMLGCLVILSTVALTSQLFFRSGGSASPFREEHASTPMVVQTAHLHGLRFPAVAWIIAFHYGARQTMDEPPWQNFIIKGRWAVTFFFILAGFMTHSSWRGEDSWATFLARRLPRVGLTYYVALLFWIFVRSGQCWEKKGASLEPVDVVLSVFMLQTWPLKGGHEFKLNGPSWFLASAAFCWFTYPFWRGMISRMGLRPLVSSVVVAMLVGPCVFLSLALYDWFAIGVFVMPHATVHWLYTWPPVCLIEFALGCLICQLAQHIGTAHARSQRSQARSTLAQLRHSWGNTLEQSAAVVEEASTSRFSPFTSLGWVCDIIFGLAVIYVALAGWSASNCGSWGADGCASLWILFQSISPMLATSWILLTSMPRTMGDAGCVVKLLGCRVLTSRMLVQPTLAMFLFQDALAMLMARASILPAQVEVHIHHMRRVGAITLSSCYLATLILVTWLVSYWWTSSFEDRICGKAIDSRRKQQGDTQSV